MKRLFALLLCLVMLLTGCGPTQPQMPSANESENVTATTEPIESEDVEPQFNSLDDENLLAYIEDMVYQDTVASLDSDEYFVESVSAVYISKEYLDELAFNSQSNVYFGYTLAELEEIFQGTKYIFTLGDNGTTTVQELQVIEDMSTETMIKNVAIGTGVILICVTVSVVTGGGVPTATVSAIFAASAKTAMNFAVSSAVFGGISSGVVRGIQTGNFDEALKAGALGATESFKWGAISGAIVGGAKEAFLLKSMTAKSAAKNGLAINEIAYIRKNSGFSYYTIDQIPSVEEYTKVYSDLVEVQIDGKIALVPKNLDLKYVSQLPDGTKVTNLTRMRRGYAPIDPATGQSYELHHIAQKKDGILAVLTKKKHDEHQALLHPKRNSEIDRTAFAVIRKKFWKDYARQVFAKGGF